MEVKRSLTHLICISSWCEIENNQICFMAIKRCIIYRAQKLLEWYFFTLRQCRALGLTAQFYLSLCACSCAPGVLCPISRHGQTRKHPNEGGEDYQKVEEPALWGKTEGVRSLLPGEASGGPQYYRIEKVATKVTGSLFTKSHLENTRGKGTSCIRRGFIEN